jgi:outer membrane protein OmpA-like peptidoglycan-associated protein
MADAITLSIETVDENGGLVDATLKLTDNQSKEIPLIKTGAGSYTASIQNQTDSKFIALAEAPGFIQARSTLLLVGQSQRTALKESLVLKKSLAEQQILSLYYKTNQAEVTNPDDLEIVKTLLKENPNVKIQIDGYTDNDGDAQYNLQLSRARADNIKKILVQSGIAASRITTNGFGASRPITDNTTGAGRKLNRRTTFTILSK